MTQAVAVVLAAGSGERLGLDEPKAFREIGGRSILALATASAAACPEIGALVVVVPARERERARAIVGIEKPVTIVGGGATRRDSVRAGLSALLDGSDVVVCHDAARPFATPGLFSRVLAALRRENVDGAVPIVPVLDTVKRVHEGMVVSTEPREELALAQTPQAFRIPSLRAAHARAAEAGLDFTDDAALMEWAGHRIATVPGEPDNFKITTELDLRLAESALASRRG